MSIYFAKSTGGFYRDDVHGARRVAIVDPAWVRPTILVADPDRKNGQPDSTAPLVEMPDAAAEPATIEIDNPATKIPADAVEITAAEYSAILAGQSAGKRIVADDDGIPVLADPPAPTESELLQIYAGAVQAHLDAASRAAGYDDIRTAVTYADEPSVLAFQREGQALRAWRSLCWGYCYSVLAAVKAGKSAMPTVDDLVAGLPALVMPQ